MDIFKNKKALIVDDESQIRDLAHRHLEEYGVHVEQASNGAMAFDMIKENNYDFVISDIQMPNGCGKELMKNLYEYGADVLIVLTTGFSDLTEQEAKRLGAKAIFEKPYCLDSILKFIKDHLPV